MKRLLIPVVLLLVMLAGCSARKANPEADTTPTELTMPTGIYVPESTVEEQTNQAVTLYRPEEGAYYDLAAIGDRILLLSTGEGTKLSLFSGTDGVPAGEIEISVDLRESVWQITDSGLVYFDPQTWQAVYLDSQLSEYLRVDLPEDMQGMPAFATDGSEVYYCTGQEIRGLDTRRGISRLIKSHGCVRQTLIDSFFDGKLLACTLETEDGETNHLLISSENGQTKSQGDNILALYTYENRFCADRMDGTVRQFLVGADDSATGQLNAGEDKLIGGLPLGGVVGYSVTDSGLQLSWYDLESGNKTAAITVKEVGSPIAVWADRWSGSVWLLIEDELLRWNLNISPVTEETSYIGSVYTAQQPDEAGLAAVQKRVDEINDTHGTAIRIWNSAVETTDGYVLEAEYQVEAFDNALSRIEPILAGFPDKFLRNSVNTKLRICLVRSIAGDDEAVRFWSNGNAYIILPIGENMEQQLLLNLGYIIDVHTLSNSPMLDNWAALNPEGVAYGAQVVPDASWLEGESRLFADAQSVFSASDDRARIIWQAMQPDNEDMFAAPVMQKKLLLVCKAIRDAWRLERSTETYIWEQYLNESIAYTK